MRFERKQGLGRAVAAIGTRNRAVRVHHVAVKSLVWHVVGGESSHPGHGEHCQPVGAVSSGVADSAEFLGDERPVVVDAGAVPQRLGVPGPGGLELLLAGEFQANRSAGGDGEMTNDVLDQHFLLRPEGTADAGLDDPDPLDWQPQQRRHHASAVVGHLGGGPDDQALVAVPVRDRDVGLDRRALDLMNPEVLVEHHVCASKAGLDISDFGLDVVHDVA